MQQKFPLAWPPGWRRTTFRTKAKFVGKAGAWEGGTYKGQERVTLPQGIQRLLDALRRLGADEVTVSTNLALNKDGSINRSQGMPSDPGVAVYWRMGKDQRCMAIDQYDRIPDNLAAVAATLEAMRAIERYGGAMILDRAFAGFVALPAPEQWWQVLGVKANASKSEVDKAYRELATKHHPDKTHGDEYAMARINRARDQAYENFPTP